MSYVLTHERRNAAPCAHGEAQIAGQPAQTYATVVVKADADSPIKLHEPFRLPVLRVSKGPCVRHLSVGDLHTTCTDSNFTVNIGPHKAHSATGASIGINNLA